MILFDIYYRKYLNIYFSGILHLHYIPIISKFISMCSKFSDFNIQCFDGWWRLVGGRCFYMREIEHIEPFYIRLLHIYFLMIIYYAIQHIMTSRRKRPLNTPFKIYVNKMKWTKPPQKVMALKSMGLFTSNQQL